MTRLARLRRADLGRRRVGPREERPAGDDEGRDEGERDYERYVGNIFVVEVLLDEVRPARAGDLPIVLWEFGKFMQASVCYSNGDERGSYWAHEFGLEHMKSQ